MDTQTLPQEEKDATQETQNDTKNNLREKKLPRIHGKTFGEVSVSSSKSLDNAQQIPSLKALAEKTHNQDVEEFEKARTRNSVDFSRIQIGKVLDDKEAGKQVEFETFSPYIRDYDMANGEIWKDKLIAADNIGLELSKLFREFFPRGRLISLYDDYNTYISRNIDQWGKPINNENGGSNSERIILSDDVKEKFRANILALLRDKGSIPADAIEGTDYIMVSESEKQKDAEKLVEELEKKGYIKREGEEIYFENNDAENPDFKKIVLRNKKGSWHCEALDASSFLKDENLDITHIVVLPNSFKPQQDKVWEILRVMGIQPVNYHNIFYDEIADPEVVSKTIREEFEKAAKS